MAEENAIVTDAPAQSKSGSRLWPPLLLALAVLLLYGRTCGFDFVNWDDRVYILDNPYLRSASLESLRHLLVPGGLPAERLFIPIPYLSYLLEAALFGLRPGVLHCTNVLLHLANVLLVYALALQLGRRRWPAFAAALLFAAHPLQVETVAWAMGRKDLLATLFGMLCLLCYWRGLEGERRWRVGALAALALATLSKPTMLVLPVILLALTMYRDGCQRPRRERWLWLLPHGAVAAAVLWLNLLIEPRAGEPAGLTLAAKLHVAGIYVWRLPQILAGWLSRLLLLSRPSPHYLWHEVDPGGIGLLSALPALLLLGWLLWAAYKRDREVCFAAAFILLTALPAASLAVFLSREFATADRYGYFPLVGVFLLLAALLERLERRPRMVGALLLALWTAGALASAHRQVGVWRDSRSLWEYVLERDPHNHLAWGMLGNFYLERRDRAAAVRHYQRAVKEQPSYARGYFNLGVAHLEMQANEAAAGYFRQTLAADPGYFEARIALASLLRGFGERGEALAQLNRVLDELPHHREALSQRGLLHKVDGRAEAALADFELLAQTSPELEQAFFQIAVLRGQLGRAEAAMTTYRQLLARWPGNVKATYNLALMYLQSGQPALAKPLLERMLVLAPRDPDAQTVHMNLGIMARQEGRPAAALVHFRQALSLSPVNDARARRVIGQTFADQGQFESALEHYQRALELGYEGGELHRDLAVAYSRLQRFALAIRHADKAAASGVTLDKALLERLAPHRP